MSLTRPPKKTRIGYRALLQEEENSNSGSQQSSCFFYPSHITLRVAWSHAHTHVCMCSFTESFRSLHSKKLQATEDKTVAMFISGDMPAARGRKKLKPMTEVGSVGGLEQKQI